VIEEGHLIVVTGATGHLGRLIVQKLVTLLPSSQVGASVRNLNKGSDLKALGVRVRQGDYGDRGSLVRAFEGATQVLIVSTSSADLDPVVQHRNAIEAARAAGARRILYTSHMGASPRSKFFAAVFHAATEDLLQASGLDWISLRNGFYAESALHMIADAPKTGVIAAPADGKASWTTRADLAEANAIICADENHPSGPTAPLTASNALDLSDLAALASDILRHSIRRETISDEAYRAHLSANGLPAKFLDIYLGIYRASREGEFSATDPTLGRLLGRAPTTMRSFLTNILAAD